MFNNLYVNETDKAVYINYGDKIRFNRPIFQGLPKTVGYFVDEGGTNVSIITEYNTISAANFSLTGASADKVLRITERSWGTSAIVINKPIEAPILTPSTIACPTAVTLTPEQLCSSLISNAGQTGETVVTLPPAYANYRFRAIITKASVSYWRIGTPGDETIYLDGGQTPKAWVQNAAPAVGDMIEFMAFKTDAGVYAWVATSIVGTWGAY